MKGRKSRATSISIRLISVKSRAQPPRVDAKKKKKKRSCSRAASSRQQQQQPALSLSLIPESSSHTAVLSLSLEELSELSKHIYDFFSRENSHALILSDRIDPLDSGHSSFSRARAARGLGTGARAETNDRAHRVAWHRPRQADDAAGAQLERARVV